MRYVVGITMDRRGRDAVSLALTLAQSTLTSHPVELDLVHVIRGVPPERAGSKPEREYQKLCLEDAQKWLAKTHNLIPKTIHSTTSVHFADSMAAGLIDKATSRPCDLVVVGAASHGPLRRFTVGSVANALLHSSPCRSLGSFGLPAAQPSDASDLCTGHAHRCRGGAQYRDPVLSYP